MVEQGGVYLLPIHTEDVNPEADAAWVVSVSGVGVWLAWYARGILTLEPEVPAAELAILEIAIRQMMTQMNPSIQQEPLEAFVTKKPGAERSIYQASRGREIYEDGTY